MLFAAARLADDDDLAVGVQRLQWRQGRRRGVQRGRADADGLGDLGRLRIGELPQQFGQDGRGATVAACAAQQLLLAARVQGAAEALLQATALPRRSAQAGGQPLIVGQRSCVHGDIDPLQARSVGAPRLAARIVDQLEIVALGVQSGQVVAFQRRQVEGRKLAQQGADVLQHLLFGGGVLDQQVETLGHAAQQLQFDVVLEVALQAGRVVKGAHEGAHQLGEFQLLA